MASSSINHLSSRVKTDHQQFNKLIIRDSVGEAGIFAPRQRADLASVIVINQCSEFIKQFSKYKTYGLSFLLLDSVSRFSHNTIV